MMFRGANTVNLDAKGRMAIPTRYRPAIVSQCEAQLIMTVDTEERCLLLYTLTDWVDIERKIEALPSFNQHSRRVQRMLIGYASDVEMDSAGRILVPAMLRKYAGLNKKVVMIGQGKKFELWDETSWQEKETQWLDKGQVDANELPDGLQALSL